jgi:hypothetical protein
MSSIHNDKRYSIALEFCGYPQKRYVARFCGEFLDSFRSYPSALLRCIGHKNPNPPIIEIPLNN